MDESSHGIGNVGQVKSEVARYPFEPPFGEKGLGSDQLEEIGEIGEGQPQGLVLEVISLVQKLKSRRESMGLSLNDMVGRSNLTWSDINRLENGVSLDPSLGTLYRYALALNAGITLDLEEIEPT